MCILAISFHKQYDCYYNEIIRSSNILMFDNLGYRMGSDLQPPSDGSVLFFEYSNSKILEISNFLDSSTH